MVGRGRGAPQVSRGDKVGLFVLGGIALAYCSAVVFPRSQVALRVSTAVGFVFLFVMGAFGLVAGTLVLFSDAPLWFPLLSGIGGVFALVLAWRGFLGTTSRRV